MEYRIICIMLMVWPADLILSWLTSWLLSEGTTCRL